MYIALFLSWCMESHTPIFQIWLPLPHSFGREGTIPHNELGNLGWKIDVNKEQLVTTLRIVLLRVVLLKIE